MVNAGSPAQVRDAAQSAEKEALRIAAVRKLPDGDELRGLAGLAGPGHGAFAPVSPALKRAAQARLAELIDEGTIDFGAIDEPAQIAQLVLEGATSRLRQLAAEALEDPAQLKRLLKQVRTKDKNVYRIIKQKCEAQNARERNAAEIAKAVNELLTALERHSHRAYDDAYSAAFSQLRARWESAAIRPDEGLEQRAHAAMERCREVIADHLRQVAQQAARLAAEQAEAQVELQAAREAREARESVLAAARDAALAEADAAAQVKREADAVREAEERVRAEKAAEDDQVFRQIGGLIRKANSALGDGSTQRAAGLRRAIDEKLPAVAGIPAHLTRQLQQLDDRLTELKQWKDFAVAPKRIALIEEMESLIGSTEDPKVLADQIKSLQEEWRTIGKGIASEAPEDWERFQNASHSAYQPCQEYFQAQAKVRKDNLENRKLVLARLTAFETSQGGGNPDGRLLAGVLREAPQEWRHYFPVDREANRTVQADFDASIGRLQAKLDAWYERNVADKRSLISRARHLLTREDSREAIEAVKQVQILWKETGFAPRDLDQSLWSEFREVCDAVFEKRQQAYAEYTASLEANKLEAVALCEEVERAASSSGPALLEGERKIPEWRAQFDSVGEMPRTDARGIHDRFERALELCKAEAAEQRRRDVERSFDDLFEAGRYVRGYERSVVGHAETAEQETLRQAAETFIAGVPHWPKGGLQAIKDRLAQASTLSGAEDESREKALRTLCIRREIHDEIPTPPEDEALRRDYQVQRLMQGMGRGLQGDDGDFGALALDWIRIGAVSAPLHDGLQQRFVRRGR